MKTLDLLKDVEAYVARQPGVWDCLSLLKAVRTKITELQSSAFAKALEIRTAQGWELKGNVCPVLYTDTINGDGVYRDDLWLATTDALKSVQPLEAEHKRAPDNETPDYYRGWRAGAKFGASVTAAQPVTLVPLTDAQIEDLRGDANRGFNIEREDYFKAFRDAEAAHGIKCLTCNGHGLIGGFQGGEAPGYVSEPCPDCNAPVIPAAAVAEGLERDSNSLEQAA